MVRYGNELHKALESFQGSASHDFPLLDIPLLSGLSCIVSRKIVEKSVVFLVIFRILTVMMKLTVVERRSFLVVWSLIDDNNY